MPEATIVDDAPGAPAGVSNAPGEELVPNHGGRVVAAAWYPAWEPLRSQQAWGSTLDELLPGLQARRTLWARYPVAAAAPRDATDQTLPAECGFMLKSHRPENERIRTYRQLTKSVTALTRTPLVDSRLIEESNERLTDVLRLDDGWFPYGSPPVSPTAAAHAQMFLVHAFSMFSALGQGAMPDDISPVPGGGVSLTWERVGKQVWLTIDTEGVINYLWEDLDTDRYEERHGVDQLAAMQAIAKVVHAGR